LLTQLLQKLAEDLCDRGKLDLSESFIDACFSSAKKGGSAVGHTPRGKGSKIMAISDGRGLPLAVHVASASPHETKLVAPTIETLPLENSRAPNRRSRLRRTGLAFLALILCRCFRESDESTGNGH
jgi:hypothetical protein